MTRPVTPRSTCAGPIGKWNWQVEGLGRSGTIVNVAPWVGDAMRGNSGLRTLVVAGYYDLATPFFHMENALASNGVPAERVRYSYSPAGHMMYVHRPSLEKVVGDVRRFISEGSAPAQKKPQPVQQPALRLGSAG